MELVCTKCGTDHPQDATVCRKCGTALRTELSTVQNPAPSGSNTGGPTTGGRGSDDIPPEPDGSQAETVKAGIDPAEIPVRTGEGTTDLRIRDSLVGRMVGEYKITSVVGRGGMGTVYAGIQPLIGKRVAVKVLKGSLSDDTEMLDRFLAEARAVNKIGHPNIVDIFSFGRFKDSTQYCVMEYLSGQSLAAYLKKYPSASFRDAAIIFAGVLDALESAHAHSIVHRDLKPDNIYLAERPDGGFYVKLLDFGIAKFVEEGVKTGQTKTGVPIGTPHYMAPEQCRGRNVDHRADIYSVGVILYEVFTGKVPFDSDSFFEVIQAHLREPPRPPSELAELPGDLEQIILWCLSKDKDDRPATVSELKARLMPTLLDLAGADAAVSPVQLKYTPSFQSYPASLPGGERILSGTGAATGPAPSVRHRPRRALAFGIPVAVALAAAAAITGYFMFARRTEKPAPKPRPGATPPPPDPSPAPPGPRQDTVTIQLLVQPRQAVYEVFLNGKKVDTPVMEVPRSREKEIEIKVLAKGYRPYVTTLLPMANMPLPIHLDKIPEPTRALDGDGRKDSASGRRRRRRRGTKPSGGKNGMRGPGRKSPDGRSDIETFKDL